MTISDRTVSITGTGNIGGSVDEAVERAGLLVPAVWLDAFAQLMAH